MKASNEFILREIAGEYMLVPVGSAASGLNGLIVLNECGSIIFKTLQKECTQEELVQAVFSEYGADAGIATDVAEFLNQLRKIHALVE